MTDDFDSPWKEALEIYFRAFLALCAPTIHDEIDWTRGYKSLDKELQQLVREGEVGRRYVDKLFKVWRRNGEECWVLIPIEVQVSRDPDFPRRMYVYNYRVHDRYNINVASLAVLADDNPNWRPSYYRWSLWGCSGGLEFPPIKLWDAAVVLIDRLVNGPAASAGDIFWQEFNRIQQEKQMPFVTTPERVGLRNGLREGIELALEIKFGAEGLALMPEIKQLHDLDQLRAVGQAIKAATTVEDVRKAVNS